MKKSIKTTEDYGQKLAREREWHVARRRQTEHPLNSPLFHSPQRVAFCYDYVKRRMAEVIRLACQRLNRPNPALLLAPIGDGADLPYVQPLFQDITGVDISPEALDKIQVPGIKKHVADMTRMDMFGDEQFDVVLVPLIFHHYLGTGFDPLLSELCRVLKPGGCFLSLEPSILHPFSWITIIARRVFGNITGQVEDECAFAPGLLTRAMKRHGLTDVKVYGVSFSHNRLPIVVAKINNILTRRLFGCPGLAQLAFMCGFYGRKPERDEWSELRRS